MTSNLVEIDIATINKLALFAVSASNQTLLEQVFKKHIPANLKDCLDKAIEVNFVSGISFLMQYIKDSADGKTSDATKSTEDLSKVTVVKTPTYRPVMISGASAHVYDGVKMNQIGKGNSQLMRSIVTSSDVTLQDLNAGIISKEELDYQNDESMSALHLLCRWPTLVGRSCEIIQKIVELGADVNIINRKDNNYTPLMYVCMYPNEFTFKIVEILLKVPSLNITLKSMAGNTALSSALLNCDEKNLNYIFIKKIFEDPRVEIQTTNSAGKVLSQIINSLKNSSIRQELWVSYFTSKNNPYNITFNSSDIKKMNETQKQALLKMYDEKLHS